ncbi:MAG: acyl carrier protein [Planctomycetaceae bacterium]|nr:acyl carrier protein [Planctomycetaceae bacterium]
MPNQNEIREAVLQSVRKIMKEPNANLADDTPFAQMDLDSLDRMSVMVEVENLLNVDLNDSSPEQFRSISDYIKFLQT